MNRTAIAIGMAAITAVGVCAAQPYYVSPDGNDANPGTREKPFATPQRAQQAVREKRGDVFLRGGTYYLSAPLVFTADDSGATEAPVIWSRFPGETPVLSGGMPLQNLDWQPHAPGILRASVPTDFRTEELFVNGQRLVLARYPNVDPSAKYFDGFAKDALAPERVARWANPAGGYFHAMHPALWGDFTWRITGRDATGKPQLEGGWQNNRSAPAHEEIRFVENIFEELDAPGEWFLDPPTHTLYIYPPANVDLRNATIETTRLRALVEFCGDERHPVRGVVLRGLTFRHAARTVMENREPLMRSDWTIYRGGAVLFEGTEDCQLEDCFVDRVGGNAIFVNRYNRRVVIRGTHIAKAGGNGICFVGDAAAARSALFDYHQVQELAMIDRAPGPKTSNYPADCLVEDCLIHEAGRVEKQTAGVQIDLAQDITVRHVSIYDVPRAGINIGSGCWGGHVIEFCDVFDTVKETGDHGSFNSWGRDRFWRPNIAEVNAWVAQAPDLPLLDAVKPIQLLNNRWRCDHGWAIDLDDGSSNYVIRNNLCLRGGIKNREGFHRLVENNILVGGGYDPHVWYANSGDVFRRNIVATSYRPAHMPLPPWGAEMDCNFLHDASTSPSASAPATQLQAQSGRDAHSLAANAHFVDPARGDYRVQDDSPALGLGFGNFPMDRFGVQKPALKALARTPELPPVDTAVSAEGISRDAAPTIWFGARLRNITHAGEMSAFGLPAVTGVLVVSVPAESPLARAGLRAGDVILSINGEKIPDTAALPRQLPSDVATSVVLRVSRDQQERIVRLTRQEARQRAPRFLRALPSGCLMARSPR